MIASFKTEKLAQMDTCQVQWSTLTITSISNTDQIIVNHHLATQHQMTASVLSELLITGKLIRFCPVFPNQAQT